MKIKLIALIVFLLAGCSALVPKNENGYPNKVVENIISGCQKTSINAKVCPCMAEKLQKKYSFDEFVKIEKSIKKGETPPEFSSHAKTIAQECAIEVAK